MTDLSLDERVRNWIAIDPDPQDRHELQSMMDAGAWDQLSERFSGRIAFGTAGLRAPMMAGPTGMNRLVVRQSAAGIARYLIAQGETSRTVVVVHDARHRSARFAADCAEVIAGHGIPVVLSDAPVPTPIGVFSVRALDAAAAIVITASHNPPRDNGLKLFMADGAQIVPPVDEHVAARIDAVVEDGIIVPDVEAARVTSLPGTVTNAYRDGVRGRYPRPAVPITIAMTAMHGVGGGLLHELLTEMGHDVHVVAAQQDPDPDFPTVGFPNPEEPGATDRLKDLVRAVGAAVGVALDPDADRMAVVVPEGDGVRQLTGDEAGGPLAGGRLSGVGDGGGHPPGGGARVSSARRGCPPGGVAPVGCRARRRRPPGGDDRRLVVAARAHRRPARRALRRDPHRVQMAVASRAGPSVVAAGPGV